MSYQGTFAAYEPGKYGGSVTVTTQKGPWKMDWKGGPPPQIMAGTPVSFEATKEGRYWKCSAIMPAGAMPQQIGQAVQNVMPQQSYMPQPQQTYPAPQQPVPMPPTQDELRGASETCRMFVMGAYGRTMQGLGSFADLKSMRDILYNLRMAWEIEMEGAPEPQNEMPQQLTSGPPQPMAGQQFDERNPPPQNLLGAG